MFPRHISDTTFFHRQNPAYPILHVVTTFFKTKEKAQDYIKNIIREYQTETTDNSWRAHFAEMPYKDILMIQRANFM